MQTSGLEHYSFLRRWAGIPNLHEATKNKDNASEERLGGYQKLGKCEETDLRTLEKHTFTLWKKTEQSFLLKWIRVALMVIATVTVVIPFIAYLCSSTSSYVNNLCPDRIFKREVYSKENNPAARTSEALRSSTNTNTPAGASARSQPPIPQAEPLPVKKVGAAARASLGSQQKEPSHKEKEEGRIRQAQLQRPPSSDSARLGVAPLPPLSLHEKTQAVLPGLLRAIQSSLVDRGEATVTVNDITLEEAKNIALALESMLKECDHPSVQVTYNFCEGREVSGKKQPHYYSFTISDHKQKARQIIADVFTRVKDSLNKINESTVRIKTPNESVVKETIKLLEESLSKEYDHLAPVTYSHAVGERQVDEGSYDICIKAKRKESVPAEKPLTDSDKRAISVAKEIEADWVKGYYRTSKRVPAAQDELDAPSICISLEALLKAKYHSIQIDYEYDKAEEFPSASKGYIFHAFLTYSPGVFAETAKRELPALLAEAQKQLQEGEKANIELLNGNEGLGKDLAELLRAKLKLPQFSSIHVHHEWVPEDSPSISWPTAAKSCFTITATREASV